MTEASAGASRRKRDSTTTRSAILGAARSLFTRDGYEGAGVRDIAASAGVDPALVIRYFGSKEQLFAEAVAQAFAPGDLLAGDRTMLGERLARIVLEKEAGGDDFDPLIALLRSAANERAVGLLREGLDQLFIGPLAERLGGEQAVLRAGLIAAYLLGLALTRDVIRSGPLVESDRDLLVALVAPILQGYIDGTAP